MGSKSGAAPGKSEGLGATERRPLCHFVPMDRPNGLFGTRSEPVPFRPYSIAAPAVRSHPTAQPVACLKEHRCFPTACNRNCMMWIGDNWWLMIPGLILGIYAQ